jgi:hypothetical protein
MICQCIINTLNQAPLVPLGKTTVKKRKQKMKPISSFMGLAAMFTPLFA